MWSDPYESTSYVRQRLMVVALVAVAIILLLYSTRSVVKTMIVTPAMAFFAAGAIWFVYLLSANTEWWEGGRRRTMIGRTNPEFIASQFQDIHAVDSRHPINVENMRGGRYVGR